MSGGGGYNDWESDLSSIIEKTNQNLKLLRRIGDKRSDIGTSSSSYDVSTTRPPTTSAAQIASDMRSFASSISNRYAAEDSAASSSRHRLTSTTAIPRAASAGPSTASSRKLHRSSSVEVDSRARARESLIIRPAVPTNAFGATSDGEDESDERSPRIRHAAGASGASRASSSGGALKRSSSLAAKSKSSSSAPRASSSAAGYGGGSTTYNSAPAAADGGALDELRKSLEVHIASRSGAFEKALADLKTDVGVVTSETNSLGMRMQELRDAVTAKLSSAGATTSAVVEHGESIGRLEKHSAVLLGWKVGVDQDLFEISSKVKSFASIQEKVNSLEGHLEALGTAIKAAHRSARHDEKIEELKDRVAMLERQAAHQLDAKAVEHTVQMRVSKEINELENRFNQSLQFLTQKIESKLQSLEKTVQSDRIEAIASVKSELLEDVDKLESRVVKRQELMPIQNAHTQMKDDIAHVQLFFERQDKRFQELKQNSTQIRDELAETRHELTKALHAQQSRVSTTLEEKVGQLAILTKDRNAKAEQKVTVLEKRFKKVEEQCKHLQESVAKVKQDALSRQAVDTVSQQRENEKLRQRLLRSIAELEHLQTAKQELERSHESQDRQFQAKLKELRTQVDEQERLKEALRTEMLQAIQRESRQIGIAQGRNALLESLLTREKQESEEKAQQVHKSRLEIAQIRQKMRTLENEVDKKMQKLSMELQTKQAQIDFLTKKLARSEDEAQKLTDSAKREKKLLAKTKELKQQELMATKLKLKELEKVASSLAQARDVDGKCASPASPRDDLTPRLVELEVKRNELQSLLTERVAEAEELKTELQEMKSEREELVKKHKDAVDAEVKRLSTEYGLKMDALEHEIVAKDAELTKLRESLDDKSELEALSDALALAQREKEELLEQLQAAQSDYQRRLAESESSLQATHSAEMEKLRAQIEHRVAEIAETQQTVHDSRERITALESEMRLTEEAHKQEVSRLAAELKDTKVETERIAGEMEVLKTEKADVEVKLSEMQTTLESISAGDEELLEEMDNLRDQHEQLTAERDRLIDGLRSKAEEVTQLTQLETQHRERIAEILQEQKDTSERLEQEIDSMRDMIGRQRDAAAESERQLTHTIAVLQAELDAAKQQSEDGASVASKLEVELQSVRQQLESALQSETSLKKRLDRIMNELAEMGASSTADKEDDPSIVLRSHFNAVADRHAQELATLSSNHALALKQAAVDHERAQGLGMQINFLSSQVNELETSNAKLKAELETQSAEYAKRAQEIGRLQDEIATTRDEKHALEEQVAELSAQVEELDASLQSQAQEKEAELNELKTSNAKLATTVGDIRQAMERLEQSKMVELDGLTSEIQELETVLVSLNERPRAATGHAASMEKEFFTNQQTIAAVGQSIRNLYAKLTSGCSVVELQDLRASLEAMESKHDKVHEGFQRDEHRLADADQEVLLNVEFLDALVKNWSVKEFAFASKYVQAAPTLASRLSRLQELFQDALSQCRPPEIVRDSTDDEERATGLSSERRGPHEDQDDQTSEVDQDDQAFGVDEVDEVDKVDEEEALDEVDEQDQSVDLDSSHGFDESQDDGSQIDRLLESHDEEDNGGSLERSSSDMEQSEDASQMVGDMNQPSTSQGLDRSGLSLDLVHSRVESCTSLIGSPTAAELSSEPFQARRALIATAQETSRAEASTTLLHSPTAALLEQRFQSVHTHEELALDDDASSMADSCTSLPNSPTGMLLQEPFQSRQPSAALRHGLRRDSFDESDQEKSDDRHAIEDSADANESASEPSSPLKHDMKLDASGDLGHEDDDTAMRSVGSLNEPSDPADNMNFRSDVMRRGTSDDESDRGDIDSASEDDEFDGKQTHVDHDDSLSQSLESMVRLVAGEESMTERDTSHMANHLEEDASDMRNDSGDDLIDGESEEEPLEDDEENEHGATLASRELIHRPHDEQGLDSPGKFDESDNNDSDAEARADQSSDEANEQSTDALPMEPIETCVSADVSLDRMRDGSIPRDESDEAADTEAPEDAVRRTPSLVVTANTVESHTQEPLHDEESEFDEEEVVSELEDSLARSTAEDEASTDAVTLQQPSGGLSNPLTADSLEDDEVPTPRLVEKQHQFKDDAHGTSGDGLEGEEEEDDDKSVRDFGDESLDLGQSKELEASHSVTLQQSSVGLSNHSLTVATLEEDEAQSPRLDEKHHQYEVQGGMRGTRSDGLEKEEEDDSKSTSDFGDESLDLGQSRELEDSQDVDEKHLETLHVEAPRLEAESDHDFGDDDEESASDFDHSADLDSSSARIGGDDREEVIKAVVQDPLPEEASHLDAAGVDEDDAISQSSLPASGDSSPVKPMASLQAPSALPLIPSLPLSRLAALRRDGDDDDDELHAAQLSMDMKRRGVQDDDDEFDDIDDAAHTTHRGQAPTTGEIEHDALCGEEEPDRFSRNLDYDANQMDEEVSAGKASQDFDSMEALHAEKLGSNLQKSEVPSQRMPDPIVGPGGFGGSMHGADDEEDVEDDAQSEELDLDESRNDDSTSEHGIACDISAKNEALHEVGVSHNERPTDVEKDTNLAGSEMASHRMPDQLARYGSHRAADDEEDVEDDEHFKEQSLEESRDLGGDGSASQLEIAHVVKTSPTVTRSETTWQSSDVAKRIVDGDHVQEHVSHAQDDDDSDFDRVLGSTHDDDDEAGGLEQSSSFDAADDTRPDEHTPAGVADMLARMSYGAYPKEHDEEDEEADLPSQGRLDEESGSMDEVERLLLEHAEKPMEKEATGVESRQFTSALRMEEDDDELIDSESEEEDVDQLQESMQSNLEDTDKLADSMASDGGLDHSVDSNHAHDLDASTNSLDGDKTSPPSDVNASASGVDESSSDDDDDAEAISHPTKAPTSVFEHNPSVLRDAPSAFAPTARVARHSSAESEDEDDDEKGDRAVATHAPQPAYTSSTIAQVPRAARHNFDESEEEDGDDAEATHAQPAYTSTTFAHVPRAARRTFDESEEEDGDDEEVAVASRVPQPVPQLAPLSGMGSRARGAGGSSGSLMKALQATRGTMAASELDDDFDEVEKLMATSQSLQRQPFAAATAARPSTQSSGLDTSAKDAEFDDDDDEAVTNDAHRTPVVASASSVERDVDALSSRTVRADHDEHDELDESLIDDEDDVSNHEESNASFEDHNDSQTALNPSVSTTKCDAEMLEDERHTETNAVVDHEAEDKLAESLIDDHEVSEHGDDDASFDDASGTFGVSFGDDVLERALEGSAKPAQETTKTTVLTPAPAPASRAVAQSESDDDESEDDSRLHAPAPAMNSSSLLLGQNRKLGALQPLPALGKKPLPGLGALSRSTFLADDDDDDMDEVERLLLERTSMKKASQPPTSSSLAARRYDAEEEDDEFDAGEHAAPSPLRDTNLPRAAHADDDEFAHIDGDDDEETDGSPKRRTNAELSASGSESQGSAPPSPSRIPILAGSTLLKKPLGPITRGASPVRSPPRPRLASAARSEDDGEDAYLEDSFDLEESLQEDE